MSEEELRAALSRLKEEIEGQPLEAERKQRLQTLAQSVEQAVNDESAETDTHGLIESVREVIGEFEVEHPRATAILNDIMVTLSNMGI